MCPIRPKPRIFDTDAVPLATLSSKPNPRNIGPTRKKMARVRTPPNHNENRMPRRKMRPLSSALPTPASSAVSTETPMSRPMVSPSETPMGSQEFRTKGSSPGAFWPSTITSVRPISIIAARETAIGPDSRNRSAMSDGRAQAGQTRLRCMALSPYVLARCASFCVDGFFHELELLCDQEGQFKGLFAIQTRIAMSVVSR